MLFCSEIFMCYKESNLTHLTNQRSKYYHRNWKLKCFYKGGIVSNLCRVEMQSLELSLDLWYPDCNHITQHYGWLSCGLFQDLSHNWLHINHNHRWLHILWLAGHLLCNYCIYRMLNQLCDFIYLCCDLHLHHIHLISWFHFYLKLNQY